MKSNAVLLLAVLLALVFYTSSIRSNAKTVALPASKQTKTKNNPGKPAIKTTPQSSPAKPAPVKLCAFNKIG
jgi:hypothetical protein